MKNIKGDTGPIIIPLKHCILHSEQFPEGSPLMVYLIKDEDENKKGLV